MRVFQGPQLRVTTPASLLGLPVDDEIESEARTDAVGEAGQPSFIEPPDDSVGPGNELPSGQATAFEETVRVREAPAGDAELEQASAKPRRRRKTPDGAAPATTTAVRKPRTRATSTRKRKDKESA
jgi:hypothetical protein